MKSTRSSGSIFLSVHDIDTVVFVCNLDKNALQAKRHIGVIRYIEWGETQATAEGVPWPEGPSVRNRQPGWWALGDCQLTQICWTRFVGEKCFHLFAQELVFADNALYVVRILRETDPELMAAILNSSLFALLQEAYGRTSLGGGLLQVFLMTYGRYQFQILHVLNLLSAHLASIFSEFGERRFFKATTVRAGSYFTCLSTL